MGNRIGGIGTHKPNSHWESCIYIYIYEIKPTDIAFNLQEICGI